MTDLDKELQDIIDFVERESKSFKERMEPRLNSLTRNSFENSLQSTKETVLTGSRELVSKHNEHLAHMKSTYRDMPEDALEVMESSAISGTLSGLKAHRSIFESFLKNTEAMPFHR